MTVARTARRRRKQAVQAARGKAKHKMQKFKELQKAKGKSK